jgi:serine/threonine protein kinase
MNPGKDGVQPDTLARRLSQGPLPLGYALQCATDVANSLRSLHEQGRMHGSVNSDSVIISGSGAQLLPPNGHARYTVAGADVSAFGSLLHEMLTGSKPSPRATPPLPPAPSRKTDEGIKIAATRLASKCLRSTTNSPAEMQRVLTEVRLLSVQAKIREKLPSTAAGGEIAQPPSSLVRRAEPMPPSSLGRPAEPKPTSGVSGPSEPQPRNPSPPASVVQPLNFTPIPAAGFLSTRKADLVDPSPSDIKCPACGVPSVYPSRPKTWFETLLAAWGSQPLRCHRCLHRYVVILRLRFAKGSGLSARYHSPVLRG